MRFLVVEDEESGREILKILLNYHKMDVDAVESAEEALDLLKTQQYAAVLVDLLLPHMDGWDLLKVIQANPTTADLKVIAITAFYDPSLAQKARKAGFTACYSKPVTPEFIPIFFELLNIGSDANESPVND